MEEKNIYKLIFKETYGFDYDELTKNRAEDIKKYIAILRNSYKRNVPNTPYEESEIRKAYMLCYYPNYIGPIYTLMNKYINKKIKTLLKTTINVSFLGAGPGPEVYGCLKSLNEYLINKKIICNLYDHEGEWDNQRRVTEILLTTLRNLRIKVNNIYGCNFMESCSNVCNRWVTCKEREFQSDIIVMQNCINHMEDTKKFEETLMEKFKVMKSGAYFIIIDLQYDNVEEVINYLKKSTGEYMNVLENGKDTYRLHIDMPEKMKEYIFVGGNNYIAKKNTNYNYIILERK